MAKFWLTRCVKHLVDPRNAQPVCLLARQSTTSSVNVFDRLAKRLQRDRAALATDAHLFDYLKEECAARLIDRLQDIKRRFPLAVYLGCQKGFSGDLINKEIVDIIYYCDSSSAFLEKIKPIDKSIKTIKLKVDEEQLPFRKNTIDLFFSSLNLHWVNDLPNTFNQIFHCLKPDGVFIASMFGGQTLFELRCSLQLAEVERFGGFSPRISPFVQPQDIGSLLQRAGFSMVTIDTDEIRINYPSIFEVMEDLKGMAENNVLANRRRLLSRDALLSAAAIYKHLYGNEDGTVPATFQIYNFIGWKPHETQQKPSGRGSATHSLKDIEKLEKLNDDVPKK